MKLILKYTLVGLLVAVVAGISVAGIAYAEGDFPKGREALAELLGLTEDELKEQLQSGKTVEDLADEAGIDLDAFQEEMHEKRLESMQSHIKEALAAGEISQDHADWLSEGFEKGFLGKEGRVGGFGPTGHMIDKNPSESFRDLPHCEGKPQRGYWENAPHWED